MAYANTSMRVTDPKKGVRGYRANVGTTRATIPLVDFQGNSFTPATTNPFGVTDLIVKNEATVSTQFELYCGDTIICQCNLSPATSLMISFNGVLPCHDTVGARVTAGTCNVTVVGVQD